MLNVPTEPSLLRQLGEGFKLFDFAALVEAEAQTACDLAFSIILAAGANVMLDGSLADIGEGRKQIERLLARNYDVTIVVDLEASRADSEKRVREEWMHSFERPTYGGLLVNPADFDRLFDPSGNSIPLQNARRLTDEFAGRLATSGADFSFLSQ